MRRTRGFSRILRNFVFIAVVAVVVCAARTACAQNSVGSITELTGSAHDERAGASVLTVTQGMPILIGDKLSTDAGAHLTLTLTDNSKLDLAEASTLVVDEHVLGPSGRAGTKVSLLGGRVRSLVTAGAMGTAPNFEVHTPNAVAGVRGTDFDTDYADNENRAGYTGCVHFTDVAVHQGTVLVTNPANPTAPPVEVTAGYETTVPCSAPALAPGPLGLTGASVGGVAAAGAGAGAAPPPACPVCPVGVAH